MDTMNKPDEITRQLLAALKGVVPFTEQALSMLYENERRTLDYRGDADACRSAIIQAHTIIQLVERVFDVEPA
jgi:hypothetical protein